MAYRGRVLVELTTTLNEDIKQPTGVLANENIISAQVSHGTIEKRKKTPKLCWLLKYNSFEHLWSAYNAVQKHLRHS